MAPSGAFLLVMSPIELRTCPKLKCEKGNQPPGQAPENAHGDVSVPPPIRPGFELFTFYFFSFVFRSHSLPYALMPT
jgi:hypothetical protein